MTFVAGIDEAGYGPLLGPLVVSGVVFEVPDALADHCLWEVLRQSLTKQLCRNDTRLPIMDSKKLHTRGGGVKALERSALVMLAMSGVRPKTFRELLGQIVTEPLRHLVGYPWYREFDPPLPMFTSEGDIATRANAVRLDMSAHGISLRKISVQPLLEGQFNQLVEVTRNKATALVGQTYRLLSAAMGLAGPADLRVVVDRQGGRSRYGPSLMTAFHGHDLTILEESDENSRYLLTPPTSSAKTTSCKRFVQFVTSGEERCLATALASVVSKYIRELFMAGFNEFWRRTQPDLAPTAGYYEDGQRFLRNIEHEVVRLRIDRNLLVRNK